MPLISTVWATLICPLEINDSINCRTLTTCCCICSGERDAKRSFVVLINNRKCFISARLFSFRCHLTSKQYMQYLNLQMEKQEIYGDGLEGRPPIEGTLL